MSALAKRYPASDSSMEVEEQLARRRLALISLTSTVLECIPLQDCDDWSLTLSDAFNSAAAADVSWRS